MTEHFVIRLDFKKAKVVRWTLVGVCEVLILLTYCFGLLNLIIGVWWWAIPDIAAGIGFSTLAVVAFGEAIS